MAPEQRLEKATQMAAALDAQAAALDKEIAADTAAGHKAEAARKRTLLLRFRARAAELRAAVAPTPAK